ncbi:MAG TPA: hypothetical protein VI653_06170 [Steroidobacteraceae bacterium]
MNSTSTSTMILVVILVVAAAAALVWVYVDRRRQSLRLKTRFGAEYGRTVRQLGDQARAEAELRKREARVAKFTIRPLTSEEAARFSQAWRRLQGRFVDNPKGAVAEADRLVTELMTARGYPMSDFERRASDISVDHPAVVDAYRAAQAIAVKDAHNAADTEELRTAIVHYRALFADLLDAPAAREADSPQHRLGVQR